MNQTRIFLLIAWLLVGGMLYLQWNKAQAPAPVPAATAELAQSDGALPGAEAVPAADGSIPQSSAVPAAPALPGAAPAATAADPDAAARLLEVRTDVLDLRVDLRGGNLVGADLLAYPIDKDRPERKVRLLDLDAANFAVAQSGLVASAGAAPSHEALFRSEDGRRRYVLAEGQDRLEVPLLWTDPSGVSVRKVLVLERGSYAITLRQEIRNDGDAPWRGYGYQQLQRVAPPESESGFSFTNPERYSFVGAAWYSPEDKFDKRKFADFAEDGPLNRDVTGGWIALLRHDFALGWVPAKSEPQRFSLPTVGNGQARDLPRGAATSREAVLWVGPKLQEQMNDVAEGLKLTLDYGVFTFIAQPMFDYVLRPLHALTGNWGWAIILTVLIIKLLLYPLSAKQ